MFEAVCDAAVPQLVQLRTCLCVVTMPVAAGT
jgi:hypothetical protein